MTRSRLIPVLRTAGVALLPAVVLLCGAGRADAGCGDHVRIVGPDGTVQRPAGHDPVPAERPCLGPECTGGPKAPAPVPPAPPGPTSDVKGLVGHAGDADHSPTAGGPPTERIGSPTRRSTAIFHPPRAS
jgi:hypothetical protein